MNAFQMVAMCFERQWAGLPPEQRRIVLENSAPLYFRLDEKMRECEDAIWVAETAPGSWAALLSVKRG